MTNKELIISFYDEVFNKRNLSGIDTYMRDDYIQHILCDDDKVCVFFKCTLENGIENKVFDMYRIENGKLAEHWDCVEHNVGSVEPVHSNGLY